LLQDVRVAVAVDIDVGGEVLVRLQLEYRALAVSAASAVVP